VNTNAVQSPKVPAQWGSLEEPPRKHLHRAPAQVPRRSITTLRALRSRLAGSYAPKAAVGLASGVMSFSPSRAALPGALGVPQRGKCQAAPRHLAPGRTTISSTSSSMAVTFHIARSRILRSTRAASQMNVAGGCEGRVVSSRPSALLDLLVRSIQFDARSRSRAAPRAAIGASKSRRKGNREAVPQSCCPPRSSVRVTWQPVARSARLLDRSAGGTEPYPMTFPNPAAHLPSPARPRAGRQTI
jgi:hypothetical protein